MLKNQRGQYMQGWELMPLLGFKTGDHLPKDGWIAKVVELPDGQQVTYTCLPANGGKHRVKFHCKWCAQFIPFGRAGQHIPACKRKGAGND